MRRVVAGSLAAATAWMAAAAWAAWQAASARTRLASLARPRPRLARGGPAWLGERLADAGLAGGPREWGCGWLGLVSLAGLAGWLAGGAATAGLALGVGIGGPWLALNGRRGRSGAAVEAALPPLLEATARGLRAGASLPVALADAASGATPVVAAHFVVVSSSAADVGLASALDEWRVRVPLPGVRLAAAALGLAAEVGGGGARALDGVAVTLRQRQAAAGEVRALATQARLSALVLTVAPLAFAALAAAGDPRTASVLLRSPVGQGCLAVGLGLDAIGAAWMGRITRAGAA